MSGTDKQDKRRAPRIRFGPAEPLLVRYKFLSHLEGFHSDEIFQGRVHNLSKGGVLFSGSLPGPEWLPRLGQGQIMIGVNIMVPDGLKAVKALASLRWCRPSRDPGVYDMGVQFEQLEPEHRANLNKFLIGVQIRTRKFTRRELLEGGY